MTTPQEQQEVDRILAVRKRYTQIVIEAAEELKACAEEGRLFSTSVIARSLFEKDFPKYLNELSIEKPFYLGLAD